MNPADVTGRIRIGVLLDGSTLARWQIETLRTLCDDYDLLLYSCANSRRGRRRLRHAFYYLLNLVTVRNAWTRRMPIPAELPILQTTVFESQYRGVWQGLPSEILGQIRDDAPMAVVKFGMGLLEVPSIEQFGIPILSYHHGDPERFRGRPAGFYELLVGYPVMGQVIQRLSNVLDAGDIIASAETKVFPHSYRATLVEAYRHSPLILKRAIENIGLGRDWKPDQWGPNHRLPGNATVCRFVLERWRRAVARMFYGLFWEKRWSVATASVGENPTLESVIEVVAKPGSWLIRATPSGYRFLADPFFHPTQGLLVEALNTRSSRGEILRMTEAATERMSGRGGHYSYPATLEAGGQGYVVPEISDWSSALAFPLGGDGFGKGVELRIAGSPHLLDPTPFNHNGKIYLFGNVASEGSSVLRLWFADSLDDEFAEHPLSPIRISPNGARMAGSPSQIGGRLVRFGQDFRRDYGDGLTAFAVTALSPHQYCEEAVDELRFGHCRGPHTLNLARGQAAFDFYVEGVSIFAGLRRWKERRAARRTD